MVEPDKVRQKARRRAGSEEWQADVERSKMDMPY